MNTATRIVVIGLSIVSAPPARAAWPQGSAVNLAVCTDVSSQAAPVSVSDGAGGLIVAWTDYRQSGSMIYAQRIRANGDLAWSTDGVPLETSVTYASSPVIVADGSGGAIVAWQDGRSSGKVWIYVQRVDSTGARLWGGTGSAVCTAGATRSFPKMVADLAHGAILCWLDQRNGLRNDIYAQRVNSAGTPQWTGDGIAVNALATFKYEEYITPDGSGGAYIAWSDGRSPLSSNEAWVQHVDGSGLFHFVANGTRACPGLLGQMAVGVLGDAVGGVMVLLQGSRGSDPYDLGATHLNAYGDFYWGSNSGITVATAAGLQYNAKLTTDGHGGMIAAWRDTRLGNDDVYAQLVDSTGAARWQSNGVPVCVDAAAQINVAVTPDSAGGAVFTWDDFRNALDHDIYAQRISAAGVMQFTDNGVAVSTATGDQTWPTIVADGQGGADIAWLDARNGNADTYASWLDAAGNLGGPVAAVAPGSAPDGIAFAGAAPNPARGRSLARYTLPGPTRIRLTLLDASGRRLQVLADEDQAAGPHQAGIDLLDAGGRALAPGLYLVRLEAGGRSITRRIAVLR